MLRTSALTVLAYLREITEIVVLGFAAAGVINAVVNKEAVARYLGSNLILSSLLGATIGVVTPLCCGSVIPTAMALYRAGGRRGPACAFLIATPWFNWYGQAALVIFLRPCVALAVAGSTVLIGFAAGLLIDLIVPRQAVPAPIPVALAASGCAPSIIGNSSVTSPRCAPCSMNDSPGFPMIGVWCE